ncbi:MAG TPA: hypothetical protein DCF42_03755 [Lachnospiraceae bacterium]|nr:hypothetical protein [Lachnospiraceae bacterium]
MPRLLSLWFRNTYPQSFLSLPARRSPLRSGGCRFTASYFLRGSAVYQAPPPPPPPPPPEKPPPKDPPP